MNGYGFGVRPPKYTDNQVLRNQTPLCYDENLAANPAIVMFDVMASWEISK